MNPMRERGANINEGSVVQVWVIRRVVEVMGVGDGDRRRPRDQIIA